MAEAKEHVVKIESGKAEDFMVLLDYVYGRKVIIREGSLFGVLELAATYQIEGLIAKCCHVLQEALDESSCWSILMVADEFSLSSLRDKAITFAGEHFGPLSLQSQFPEVNGEVLEKLISSDVLIANCEEEEVLEAVLRWGEARHHLIIEQEEGKNGESGNNDNNNYNRRRRSSDHVVMNNENPSLDVVLPRLLSHIRWPLISSMTTSSETNGPFCVSLHHRLSSFLSPVAVDAVEISRRLAQSAKTCRRRRRICHLKRMVNIEGHSGAVSALAFVGDRLISGSWDQTARVWEIDQSQGNARCIHIMRGHKGAVLAITVFQGTEDTSNHFIITGKKTA